MTTGTLENLVGNETLGVTATGEFDDANAGDRTATAHYTLADGESGGLAANYVLADTSHQATITPRPVSVTADDKQKTVGTDDPAFTYRAGCASGQSVDCGLVDGESLAGELSREGGEAAGDYAIEQGTVTPANNPNYAIDFEPGSLIIASVPVEPEPTPPAEPEPEPAPPVEPEPATPVEPEPATPVEPEPAPPVEPEPATPVEPEPATPVEPEPATPVEPEPATPVEPEPATPVEPEPATPVEPEPATPVEPEPDLTLLTSGSAPQQVASTTVQQATTDPGMQVSTGTTASFSSVAAASPNTTSLRVGEQFVSVDGLLIKVQQGGISTTGTDGGIGSGSGGSGGSDSDSDSDENESDLPSDNNL